MNQATTEYDNLPTMEQAQDYWIEVLTPMQRYEISQFVGHRQGESLSSRYHRCLTHLILSETAAIREHAAKLEQELQEILNS